MVVPTTLQCVGVAAVAMALVIIPKSPKKKQKKTQIYHRSPCA